MVKIIFLICLVIIAAWTVDACDTKHKDVQDCKLKYHVCDHINHASLQYQAEATDEDSGASEKGDWHSSADHAAADATYKLTSKDLKCHKYNDCDCNCEVQAIDQSTCHLQVAVCWYLASYDDAKAGKATYRGYAFDADAECQDHEGTSDGFKDPEECGQAAATDLFNKYPDTAKKCGQTSLTAAVNAAMINATHALEGRFKGMQL